VTRLATSQRVARSGRSSGRSRRCDVRKTEHELRQDIRNAVLGIRIACDDGIPLVGRVDRQMLVSLLRISEGLAVDARRLLDGIDEEQNDE